MKKRIIDIILLLILAAGLFAVEIPKLYELKSQMKQSVLISGYDAYSDAYSEEEISVKKDEADSYNERLVSIQQSSAFSYQPADPDDREYYSMLEGKDQDNTMALLSIPKISVNLPVVHGTEEDQLKYAAGHMYGTSLPIGGSSSHCVIAAHTGLVNARLFTDLVKLEKGDRFSVIVLNEKHNYAVDRILVVLPEEEDCFLQIEDNTDYVTLYTCTPYGVNDHRLLVRGIRTESVDAEAEKLNIEKTMLASYLKAGLLIMIPISTLVIGVLIIFRKEK